MVWSGLGHGGHGVRREAIPARYANVRASVAGDVLSPRKVGHVDLDGRTLGADPDFAVAAQSDRPDVARCYSIGLNQFHHAGAELFEREGQLHPVDLGRVKHALHVLGKPEDGRALRLAVAANPLKHAGAVMNHVAHHMQGGLFPGNEVAVVPDFRGRLDRHGGVKKLLELLCDVSMRVSRIEPDCHQRRGTAGNQAPEMEPGGVPGPGTYLTSRMERVCSMSRRSRNQSAPQTIRVALLARKVSSREISP